MFNLEQSIADWRHQMLAVGIQSPVPLDELEEHLRDEVEQQMESGLEPQAALAAAIEKVGQAQNLQVEFTKIGGVKKMDGLEKCVTAIFAVMFLVVMVPLAKDLLFDRELSWTWRLAGLANIGLFATLGVPHRYMYYFFPIIPNQRTRWAVGVSSWVGEIGIALFLNQISPHFGLSSGEHFLFTLWVLILALTGGVVRNGLEEAAKRATTATNP